VEHATKEREMSEGKELLGEIFDVRGTRVIVTGAASGIGRSIAVVLAQCGARVTLADRDAQGVEVLSEELSAENLDVDFAVVDITDVATLEAAFARVVTDKGAIDVVFANAGGSIPSARVAPENRVLTRYPEAAWSLGIAQNLSGAFSTIQVAARHMRPVRHGRIIVTASTAGLRPDPYVTYDYAAAKAGLVNLVRQAALDLASDGVTINAIAPGPFKTNIGGPAAKDPEVIAKWGATVPLGRMGETEEMRGLAVLLASPASSFMTGAVYPIDGGALALSEQN
jgi:NAD(P)-dependent dehydrogenase (short-subunit alcohol dehydrogenase family)